MDRAANQTASVGPCPDSNRVIGTTASLVRPRRHLLACAVVSDDRVEAAFLAELPPESRAGVGVDLRAAIVAAYERGRNMFPNVSVDEDTFARHLARATIRMPDGAAPSALAAEDLYLACACAVGVPGAVNALVEREGPLIRRSIARIVKHSNTEEIEQALLADLVVGSPTSPPEIGAYAGRAPLARWLEVVAQRAALRWLRDERARTEVKTRAAREPQPPTETTAETAMFRERYSDDFERAMKDALARAPEQDRAILRLHMLHNVSVEKIGQVLGVSQSTASRWLAKARDSVLDDLKSILRERLKMSSVEIESLAGLLASRLDLSISRVLHTDHAPPRKRS
jgi:RNA polymerase sigma-70 factor (ECF subfamily)